MSTQIFFGRLRREESKGNGKANRRIGEKGEPPRGTKGERLSYASIDGRPRTSHEHITCSCYSRIFYIPLTSAIYNTVLSMPNNHHPHFRRNVFHPQADPTIVHQSPTPIPVLTDERTTIAHPAGTPRSHSLDVEQTFDISPYVARLPADRAARRPTSASTHTNTSQQGREHPLHSGEGVLLEGASPYSASSSGTNTRRPNIRGYSHTSEESRERGARRNPDNTPASRELLERPLRGVRQDKARSKSAREARDSLRGYTNVSRAPFTNNAVVRSQAVAGANKSSSRSPCGLTRPSRRTLSASPRRRA